MDRTSLNYSHFEKLPLSTPVDRLDYIAHLCTGKQILDIGCLDETALVKRDTEFWLHSRICSTADRVLGVDSSEAVSSEGITTASNGRIIRCDALQLDSSILEGFEPDLIVAGEFIEHVASPLQFLLNVRKSFPGRMLVLSTPNGCSLSNLALGMLKREVQHPDHLHSFTFKTLNTLCMRSGMSQWNIIPYRFFATEMILRSRGGLHASAFVYEKTIRILERIFPALSFGYIVVAKT